MYTLTEIDQKRTLARDFGLSGAELLDDTAAVQRSCNGIGASWMWDSLRDVIGAFNPSLVIVADIHDRRYDIGGDDRARRMADEEFLLNGLRVADAAYRWYDPRRYRVRAQARKFYAILRAFGGAAWPEGGAR